MSLRPARTHDGHVVTAAPMSRVDEQRHRIRQYLVTMGIRTFCFAMILVVDGWARWGFAIAAMVLPFFAVVAANAASPILRGRVAPVTPMPDTVPRLTPPTTPAGK